jgi:hypothetical protein
LACRADRPIYFSKLSAPEDHRHVRRARTRRPPGGIDRFIVSVGIEFNKLYNSHMRTEAELQAFKEEMREFRERGSLADTAGARLAEDMREFRERGGLADAAVARLSEEMTVFKEEMREFKDEMAAFKDEMRADRDEAREERRHWNRQWGDLANKLGTLVEDLVYPSLARVIKETLTREVERSYLRPKHRLSDGRVRGFEAIAVTADLVCLNSTKSTLRSADVDRFPEEIAAFREFLPEYRQLPLVAILASLTVEESVLAYAERQGFLVLAVGDELMEVKNRPGYEPKRLLAPERDP